MEAVMAINRSTPENFVYDNTSKINKKEFDWMRGINE